mmetsp:Transcript_27121/g.57581  ORF Transcript_27121/g.57581 Transcript_27121/m.57581 type:complete len:246 (+) Transcript_27121:504-1241(+)
MQRLCRSRAEVRRFGWHAAAKKRQIEVSISWTLPLPPYFFRGRHHRAGLREPLPRSAFQREDAQGARARGRPRSATRDGPHSPNRHLLRGATERDLPRRQAQPAGERRGGGTSDGLRRAARGADDPARRLPRGVREDGAPVAHPTILAAAPSGRRHLEHELLTLRAAPRLPQRRLPLPLQPTKRRSRHHRTPARHHRSCRSGPRPRGLCLHHLDVPSGPGLGGGASREDPRSRCQRRRPGCDEGG